MKAHNVGFDSFMEDFEESFTEGDQVKVIGRVVGHGQVGEVTEVSPSGRFYYVRFDGKIPTTVSYHGSDLTHFDDGAEENFDESSGADCHFYEKSPGKWYYDIQNYPYGETHKYTTHGPFPDYRAAEKHLGNHYQNPGGFSVKALPCKNHEPYSPRYSTQKFCAKCGKFLGEAKDFPSPPKYGDPYWYPGIGELKLAAFHDRANAVFYKQRTGERIVLSLDDPKLEIAASWD